jgi:hypothetical protein
MMKNSKGECIMLIVFPGKCIYFSISSNSSVVILHCKAIRQALATAFTAFVVSTFLNLGEIREGTEKIKCSTQSMDLKAALAFW